MIDHFTKEEFEAALVPISSKVKIDHLGLVMGEYTYRIPFGSAHCFIELRSSVGRNGKNKEDGEDSIRCWLVTATGYPIGGKGSGKVQSHVKRTPGWQKRMLDMIDRTVKFGLWVQPCKKCGQLLCLSVKESGKVAYLYCTNDLKNKDTPGYNRHMEMIKLDENAEIDKSYSASKPKDAPKCPTCNLPLTFIKEIRHGGSKGKSAWCCPAKERGKFLNHYFQVIE